MIWLAGVSYATVVPFTNCGASALLSNVHRLRAFAGSWMSRTTTVGSPTIVPMTRLSPAGIATEQCTAEAALAGVEPATGLGVAEAVAEGALDVDGAAVVCAVGVAPPPHPTVSNPARRATRLARTA